jgi:hypothetical protein
MGNDARTITETAPGVWSMNATARKTLGDAVDATLPTTARNYPFYANLLAPTIASAEHSDLSALRQRGDVSLDLGKKLPFDLAFTYNRDVKTDWRRERRRHSRRGHRSVDVLGRWMRSPRTSVSGLATFKGQRPRRSNIYNDRVDSLIVDNPFRATDRRLSRRRCRAVRAGAFQHLPTTMPPAARSGLVQVRAPDADHHRPGVRHLDAERSVHPHSQFGDLHAGWSAGERHRLTPEAIAERQDEHGIVQLHVRIAPGRRTRDPDAVPQLRV